LKEVQPETEKKSPPIDSSWVDSSRAHSLLIGPDHRFSGHKPLT
jgi:hypothetical protein